MAPHNLRGLTYVPLLSQKTSINAKLALLNIRSLTDKQFICNNYITSNNIDFLLLTETWLKNNLSLLNAASPPTHSYFQKSRLSSRGGGVAVIFNSAFSCTLLSFGDFTSFEYLAFCTKHQSTLVILVYRPPNYNACFITEFSDLLLFVMPKYTRVILTGDFNIHVCCPNNAFATEFSTLVEFFDFIVHPTGPPHDRGHTLDLVLSSGVNITNLETSRLGI